MLGTVLDSLRSWWEDPEPHRHIFELLTSLSQSQSLRSQNNLRFARLYGNLDILGLSPVEYFKTSQPFVITNRLAFNVVRSCVDTVYSRIAKNKPRPQFLTSGGEWELQEKAKSLNKFVQGIFYETDFYAKRCMAFRDAEIFGTGFLKVYIQDKRICFDRVIPEEITVDATESIYGSPQSLFQTKAVPRSILLAKYGDDPAKKAAIIAAENIARPSSDTVIADMVNVVEAWHLPSKKNGPDGRHVITIKNCTLFQENYTYKKFPFIIWRWSEPVVGFFGTGLAEELLGIQLEINKLLRQIQLSHHLLSTPKVFLENNSDVVSTHINNDVGAIVKFRGVMPEIKSFQTVQPEIYMHLERLYNKAFEIAGVSAMSAQSKKPAGLDSAPSLREFSEIESERFALVQQRDEAACVEAAEWCIDLGREIVKKHGGFTVKAPNKKVIEAIDFKTVDLDDSTYILQCFPTNFLPHTPSGRLASVQELMQAGLISKEIGLSLLDFPDLESAMTLTNAALNDVMLNLSEIITKGKYTPPDPVSNLTLGRQLGQASYLKAKIDKVPKERLEMLRMWISECVRLEASTLPNANPANAQAQGTPNPGLPQGTPQAVPAAPPVSQLLPNSP